MLTINYKGYEISQVDDNNVIICKNNEKMFHKTVDKKLNEEELKETLENYFKLLSALGLED